MIDLAIAILYSITVALKAPVVLGVLLALIWALFEIGAFLREWFERRHRHGDWQSCVSAFTLGEKADEKELLDLLTGPHAPELVKSRAVSLRSPTQPLRTVHYERLLHELEFEAARRWSRLRIGLRIGPVLGLMGTLIPMGPALMNISQGNLAVMSNDLIIAFSTTVAGLLVGALFYVMLINRQYWYAKDIDEAESMISTVVEAAQS